MSDIETRLAGAEALIRKLAGVFRFYEQQHVMKYHNNPDATVDQMSATRAKAARNAELASEAEQFLGLGPVEPISDA